MKPDWENIKRHPLSAACLDMAPTEFEEFLEDVKANGFTDPTILLKEGMVLDGWHRVRAARELKRLRRLKPAVFDKSEGQAVALVVSRNLQRRHLTASQRAAAAALLSEGSKLGGDRQSAEAKTQKQSLNLETASGGEGDNAEDKPPMTAQQAAEATGSSLAYVGTAKKLKRDNEDVFNKVAVGSMSLNSGVNLAKWLDEANDDEKFQVVNSADPIKASRAIDRERKAAERKAAEKPKPKPKYTVADEAYAKRTLAKCQGINEAHRKKLHPLLKELSMRRRTGLGNPAAKKAG